MQVISAHELISKLLQNTANAVTVVDVRDEDHAGGNIRGSIHVPSATFDMKLPSLVESLKNRKFIVFHCMLSQVRGPKAMMRFSHALKNAGGVPSRVYLLDRGFQNFVQVSRTHPRFEDLVEHFDERQWRSSYF